MKRVMSGRIQDGSVIGSFQQLLAAQHRMVERKIAAGRIELSLGQAAMNRDPTECPCRAVGRSALCRDRLSALPGNCGLTHRL